GLVRLDYGRAVARRATTLLMLFPLSFFLFAAYSEGTFLLCTIAFFYALRLERWWQAGLWGLLAAAARPPGVLLLVPFLIPCAQDGGQGPRIARSSGGHVTGPMTRGAPYATACRPWRSRWGWSSSWPSSTRFSATLCGSAGRSRPGGAHLRPHG